MRGILREIPAPIGSAPIHVWLPSLISAPLRFDRRFGRWHRRLAVTVKPQARRFTIAHSRNVPGCARQAKQRHIPIHALVLARLHEVGLVPDAHAAVGANRLIEVLPGRKMRLGWMTREALQIVE